MKPYLVVILVPLILKRVVCVFNRNDNNNNKSQQKMIIMTQASSMGRANAIQQTLDRANDNITISIL